MIKLFLFLRLLNHIILYQGIFFHHPGSKFIYLLDEIYASLNFNEYDAFPRERVEDARRNIEKIYRYLGNEPVCPRHPQHALSLYCEKDK